MMDAICDWLDSRAGKTLIAGALFVTGLGWAGWLSGFTDWLGGLGVGMWNVANLFGIVSLVGGTCLLYQALSSDPGMPMGY